jgi:cell filamentation protein, protein adenylyltransferase
MFEPNYRITGKAAKALMAVEADRQAVASLPLTAPMLDSLRRTARLLSTHYSTRIEGNRLSPTQVVAVVEGEGNFPGRERDEAEVRNYFAALGHVERIGRTKTALTQTEIRTIHGLVMTGRPKATRYRTGQNAIRDARTGRIVYLPPEAKDLPALMKELVGWVNASQAAGALPVPVVAATAHYQFATIHPYFDGNGRTARLLTTLLLHRNGYGLNGIYSLEEYYAANLDGYYTGLSVGPSHNYYMGRAEADFTSFVEYFVVGMADAFAKVRARAEEGTRAGSVDEGSVLRKLTPRQRNALGLFRRSRIATAKDMARYFRMKPRMASLQCAKWVKEGFLVIENASTKGRSYRLAQEFEAIVAGQEARGRP